MHRLGLLFADRELETAFRQHYFTRTVGQLRLCLAVSLVFWFGASLGAGLYPTPEHTRTIILLVIVPTIGGLLAVTWLRRFARYTSLAGAVVVTVVGLAWLYMLERIGHLDDYGYPAMMVQFTCAAFAMRLRFPHFVVATTAQFLALITGILTHSEPHAPQLWFNVLALPGATVSFALGGAYVLERGERMQFEQGRLIAEQRATIERLLQQEISHQVAERSRALGEVLAKVDVALPGVRLEPGRVFSERYEVKRELGVGGMGAVYEVERLTDRQRLALKVITGNVSGAQAARFAREAEIGARVRHPNLVQIVDVGVSPAGAPYLVMELVEGKSLEQHRDAYADRGWALGVLRQVASGLAALHAAGVVHRDLKPGNVLLAGDRARISDFGISRFGVLPRGDRIDPLADTADPTIGLKGHSLTKTGALIGTPLYMAPEAAQGGQAVDKPADVFALGLIAYELLTGRMAFDGPVVMAVMEGRALPAPSPLEPEIVLRCLALDPARRPTVEQVVEAMAPNSIRDTSAA